MSGLTLHIDSERWRHHISHYVARHHGDLIPVIKGNGYGFGIPTLAREASNFEASAVACYNAEEAAVIRSQFSGDILLLSPHEILDESWVIHTVAPVTPTDAHPKRFVVEILSPVKRHGFSVSEVQETISKFSHDGVCEGIALHLPIEQRNSMTDWVTQVIHDLAKANVATESFQNTLWLSHISAEDLVQLRDSLAHLRFKVRVGTDLWLGARTSLSATAQVIDVHPVTSGERIGYRQTAPGKGWVIVAAGGTSQGIGLEVPKAGLKEVLKSLLRIFGWNPSPFSWNGRALAFVEPPHMHNSLLFLKSGAPPQIGEEIGLNVRFTTTSFDEIIFE